MHANTPSRAFLSDSIVWSKSSMSWLFSGFLPFFFLILSSIGSRYLLKSETYVLRRKSMSQWTSVCHSFSTPVDSFRDIFRTWCCLCEKLSIVSILSHRDSSIACSWRTDASSGFCSHFARRECIFAIRLFALPPRLSLSVTASYVGSRQCSSPWNTKVMNWCTHFATWEAFDHHSWDPAHSRDSPHSMSHRTEIRQRRAGKNVYIEKR